MDEWTNDEWAADPTPVGAWSRAATKCGMLPGRRLQSPCAAGRRMGSASGFLSAVGLAATIYTGNWPAGSSLQDWSTFM